VPAPGRQVRGSVLAYVRRFGVGGYRAEQRDTDLLDGRKRAPASEKPAETRTGPRAASDESSVAEPLASARGPRLRYIATMSLSRSLAEARFRDCYHACAFVSSPEEEREVIDPFLLEGTRRGGKAVYYVDPMHVEEHSARLRADAAAADLVEVTSWSDVYLKDGRFDPARVMSALEEIIRGNGEHGNKGLRFVGQMGWVFSSPPGIEDLVAYEASVNSVLNRGKTPTVCVYDVRRLSGSLMMDLLRAHPLTILNGVLHENPFYTPAEEMLADLQRRRAMS
jgi:hypothetical protein